MSARPAKVRRFELGGVIYSFRNPILSTLEKVGEEWVVCANVLIPMVFKSHSHDEAIEKLRRHLIRSYYKIADKKHEKVKTTNDEDRFYRNISVGLDEEEIDEQVEADRESLEWGWSLIEADRLERVRQKLIARELENYVDILDE